MKDNPRVSIIILNWNGKKMINNCLASLFNITDYPKDKLDIIVIDNGSTDGSSDFIKMIYRDRVHLVNFKNNLGFIKGNNFGINYAINILNADFILLLNNDTEIIQKDWLLKLIEVAISDEQIGVVGPKLIFPNKKIQWCGRRREKNPLFLILQTVSARFNPGFGEHEEDAKLARFIGEVNTISGACMLVKSKLIKDIGLLDISLCPMYQEDVEYSLRAWKMGYRVIYVGDVSVVHYEGYNKEISNGSLDDNERLFWALRNSMIVSVKYFGFIKTLFIGMPIFFATVFLDKKSKYEKVSIRNIRLRANFNDNLFLFLKAIKYGFLGDI